MPFIGVAMSALAAGGLSAFAATSFGGFLLQAAASAALSLLAKAKQKTTAVGIKTSVTTSGGVEPQVIMVGRFATAGHLVAPPYTHGKVGKTPNAYLQYIIEVSDVAGPTLSRVIIDGEYSEIGTTAHADFGLPLLGQAIDGENFAWVKYYDGNQTTADPMLAAKYSDHPDRPWTEDHIGTGTAYAILTFRYKRDLFDSFPTVIFELEGIPLYDIRKDTTAGGSGSHRWDDVSTWEQTRNLQVIKYNVLRGIPIGDEIYGALADDLPLSNWAAAMNVCDVLAGDARPQFEGGFEIDVSLKPLDIIKELDKACLGQSAEMGGIFRTGVGAPASPVMFITDDDIVISDPQELDPFSGLASTYNAISGTYSSPEDLWKPKDAPALFNAEWEEADGGRRLPVSLDLNACFSLAQTQQVMSAYIKDHRRFRTHTIVLPPDASGLETLNTISWSSERNGYVDKLFEVVRVTVRTDTLLHQVTLRERDPEDNDFQPSLELPQPVGRATVTPLAAQGVSGWGVNPAYSLDSDQNIRRPALELIWDGDYDDVQAIKWEARILGQTEIAASSSTHDVSAGRLVVRDALPNTPYQARARLVVNRATEWSSWVTATTYDVRPILSDFDPSVQAEIDAAAQSAAADKLAAATAAAASVTAAAGAEVAEAAALSAQQASEQLQIAVAAALVAAEDAQNGSEAARDLAVTAKQDALNALTQTQAALASAAIRASESETARDAAVAAQTLSEAASASGVVSANLASAKATEAASSAISANLERVAAEVEAAKATIEAIKSAASATNSEVAEASALSHSGLSVSAARESLSTNYDFGFNNPSAWFRGTGASGGDKAEDFGIDITPISDPEATLGGNVIIVSGASMRKTIPIDTSRTYRLKVRFKVVNNGSNPLGPRNLIGYQCLDAAGNNIAFVPDGGTFSYLDPRRNSVADGWQEIEIYVSGEATGTASHSSTIFRKGTASIRLMVYENYTVADAETMTDYFLCEDVTDSEIAKTAATASAESATLASASESAAGQFATVSETKSIIATTKAGEALVSAGEAATSSGETAADRVAVTASKNEVIAVALDVADDLTATISNAAITEANKTATTQQALAAQQSKTAAETAAGTATIKANEVAIAKASVDGSLVTVLAAKELAVEARDEVKSLADLQFDGAFLRGADYWVYGYYHSVSERATTQNVDDAYGDITIVEVASEGSVLQASGIYRIMTERAVRPFVEDQKIRVTIKTRITVDPISGSGDHTRYLWIVGADESGACTTYAGMGVRTGGVVTNGWFYDTYDFIPFGMRASSVNAFAQSSTWCLMIGLNGYDVNVGGAVSQISQITIDDITSETELAASITAEETARIAEGTALSNALTALTASMNTADAAAIANIVAEAVARANADSSLASQINSVETTFNSGLASSNAAINAETLARSNADAAIALIVTALDASTTADNNVTEANLTAEIVARSNAINAIAVQIATMQATANTDRATALALINSEAATRASADLVSAGKIEELSVTSKIADTLNGANNHMQLGFGGWTRLRDLSPDAQGVVSLPPRLTIEDTQDPKSFGNDLVARGYSTFYSKAAYPIDVTRKYRMIARVKRSALVDSNVRCYIGFSNLDENFVGVLGQGNTNTYCAVPGLTETAFPVGADYVEFTSPVVTGTVVSGLYAFRLGTVMIRPMALLNYSDTNVGNVMRLSYLEWRDVTEEEDLKATIEANRIVQISDDTVLAASRDSLAVEVAVGDALLQGNIDAQAVIAATSNDVLATTIERMQASSSANMLSDGAMLDQDSWRPHSDTYDQNWTNKAHDGGGNGARRDQNSLASQWSYDVIPFTPVAGRTYEHSIDIRSSAGTGPSRFVRQKSGLNTYAHNSIPVIKDNAWHSYAQIITGDALLAWHAGPIHIGISLDHTSGAGTRFIEARNFVFRDITDSLEANALIETERTLRIADGIAHVAANSALEVAMLAADAALTANLTNSDLASANARFVIVSNLSLLTAAVNSGDAALLAQVTTALSAIATIEGHLQAQAGITAEVTTVNGETVVAGFKATSYANPDGSTGSVLKLLGMDTFVDGVLKSNGFLEDTSGWRINKNGDAQFNDLAVRGDLIVNGVINNTWEQYTPQSVLLTDYSTVLTVVTASGLSLQPDAGNGVGGWRFDWDAFISLIVVGPNKHARLDVGIYLYDPTLNVSVKIRSEILDYAECSVPNLRAESVMRGFKNSDSAGLSRFSTCYMTVKLVDVSSGTVSPFVLISGAKLSLKQRINT